MSAAVDSQTLPGRVAEEEDDSQIEVVSSIMGNASETGLFVSTIPKEHDIFMGTLYTTFCVMSFMGNGILLFVAYRKRSSLKPAEYFIVNLSISDLGMTVTLFPLAIPSAFAHKWLFGELACLCYAVCGVLFGLSSLANLTTLSSVCCLKVCFPIYGNKFSSSHASLMIVGVWCYASVFAIGPLAHWGQYGPEPYGTACCIDWYAPNHDTLAMSYIICLFLFCYAVPCTIIFLSYTFILLTVRGSRQALSVAVCIGFLSAWTPYTIVAMWAAFSDPVSIPPIAFALAAIFAKSSTIYNPVVYLLFKPNFRKSLTNDTAEIRRRITCSSPCKGSHIPREKDQYPDLSQHCPNKDDNNSTRLSNGLPDNHGACLHCAEVESQGRDSTPQRTARVLTGSVHSELTVSQMSDKMKADFI